MPLFICFAQLLVLQLSFMRKKNAVSDLLHLRLGHTEESWIVSCTRQVVL